MKHVIAIRPDGTAELIHADSLRALLEAGEGTIRRASQVEPTPGARRRRIYRPSAGPSLSPPRRGPSRSAWEAAWIERYHLKERRSWASCTPVEGIEPSD